MDLKKIGGCLKDLRKEKGLTQEQLAEQFNVSQRTVSRWETGSVIPDIDIIIELSDFYGVDLRSLLNGEKVDNRISAEMKGTVREAVNYSKQRNGYGRIASLISMILGLMCLGFFFFAYYAIRFATAEITTTGIFAGILLFAVAPVFSLAAITFGIIGLFRSHNWADRYRDRSTVFSIVGFVGAVIPIVTIIMLS